MYFFSPRILVNFFLLVYQIGTCCVYVIFIASNLKDVIDPFTSPMDIRLYMLLILLPLILINYVRNLKYLAPFSTIGSFLAFISFGIIFSYIFRDLPDTSDRIAVAPVRGWFVFFGIVLFSLESIGVVRSSFSFFNFYKTPCHKKCISFCLDSTFGKWDENSSIIWRIMRNF